jgi:hypothetical protein
VFECRALGCRTEDRNGCLIGEDGSDVGCCAGVGFPDADMDQDVRVERGDRVDDPVVLVGVNSVKDRTMETVSRWIGIDTGQFTHPRLGFEQAGDRGAEFPAHTTDEHSFPSHHHER